MTLRLVGREPSKPPRRKFQRAQLLSAEEERRFRQAMRNLQGAFGSWECLMDATKLRSSALFAMLDGTHRVSGDMIVRAMRASGLGLKDLIGEPAQVTRCRACGGVKRAS